MSTLCRWVCVHVLRFASAKCVIERTFYLAAFPVMLSLVVAIGLLVADATNGTLHAALCDMMEEEHLMTLTIHQMREIFSQNVHVECG